MATIGSSILSWVNKPKLTWSPPAFDYETSPATAKQPIYVDCNAPTQFRGNFNATDALAKGCVNVYYPAGADMSWVPAGFTKIAISATVPSNGRYQLGSDGTTTAYIFWPTWAVDTGTGYAYRSLRIAGQGSPNLQTRDCQIILPTSGMLDREFQVDGALRVRIIGGYIKGSYPPQTYSGYSGPTNGGTVSVLRFANIKYSVYMEGVVVDCDNLFGLDTVQPGPVNVISPQSRPNYYVQNCALINAKSDYATGLHADNFQPNGPVGYIFMDRVWTSSTYQGLYLNPAHSCYGHILKNVYMTYTQPWTAGAYLYWVTSSVQDSIMLGTNPYIMPHVLDKVYVMPKGDGSDFGLFSIWPTTDPNATLHKPLCCDASADGQTFTWNRTIPTHSGKIRKGAPPSTSDSVVKQSEIGAGYTSPGYLSPSPDTTVIPTSWPYATSPKSIYQVDYTYNPIGTVLTCVDPVWPGGATTSISRQWYIAGGSLYGGAAINGLLLTGETGATYTIKNDGYTATTSTSLTPTTGTKTFTTQAGKNFVVGQVVTLTSRSDNSKNMLGYITAYSGTSMTVVVSLASTGTALTDWDICPKFYCLTTSTNPAGTFTLPTNSI